MFTLTLTLTPSLAMPWTWTSTHKLNKSNLFNFGFFVKVFKIIHEITCLSCMIVHIAQTVFIQSFICYSIIRWFCYSKPQSRSSTLTARESLRLQSKCLPGKVCQAKYARQSLPGKVCQANSARQSLPGKVPGICMIKARLEIFMTSNKS